MEALDLYTCRACSKVCGSASPAGGPVPPEHEVPTCSYCGGSLCRSCERTGAGAPGPSACCRATPVPPPRKPELYWPYAEEPRRVCNLALRDMVLGAPGPVECLCVANTMVVEHHHDYFFKELRAYSSGRNLAKLPAAQEILERGIESFGLDRTVFFWRLSQVWAEGAAFVPVSHGAVGGQPYESVCAHYTQGYTYDLDSHVSYYPASRLLVIGNTFPRDESSLLKENLVLTPAPALLRALRSRP